MKNLLNLKNAKILSKVEQRRINGGSSGCCTNVCSSNAQCGPMRECFVGTCLGCDTRMCRTAGSGGIE